MIRTFWQRFALARQAAIAVTLAVSLVPLVMFVGIAIDFTFWSQARTQSNFASEAAATHAIRMAAATYSLEVAHGTSSATAAAHAVAAGETEGDLWFDAELGNFNRASLQSRVTTVTYNNSSATPPNFTAVVNDTASYPPIFNPLFGRASPWVYYSTATATTQFSYVQILMMLDTSGSMMIGADPSDIATMERNSVCPLQGEMLPSDYQTAYGPAGYYATALVSLSGNRYSAQTGDGDGLDFSQFSNYADPTKTTPNTDSSGQCAVITTTSGGKSTTTKYGIGAAYFYDQQTGTAPSTACALACHSSARTTADGYYGDLYGMARREGVNLRIDTVFNATEQVIQDMETSEAVANQFSIGVYQFNADVLPIVKGSAGTDALPEATANLAGALSAVQAVDYKKTPSETVIPQLINEDTTLRMSGGSVTENGTTYATPGGQVNENGGDTNLKLSISDLVAGNATGGSTNKLTVSGGGSSAASPQKFMFIVTDGMDDNGPSNGGTDIGGLVKGDMTSIAGESAGTGTCSYLKNTLKYTVYVLYVTYYPLANSSYYSDASRGVNAATIADFPADTNATVQALTEVPSITTLPTRYTSSPTALALQACASSKGDFYEASTSSDIQTALGQMLKSALASTIRLTN